MRISSSLLLSSLHFEIQFPGESRDRRRSYYSLKFRTVVEKIRDRYCESVSDRATLSSGATSPFYQSLIKLVPRDLLAGFARGSPGIALSRRSFDQHLHVDGCTCTFCVTLKLIMERGYTRSAHGHTAEARTDRSTGCAL